MNTRGLPLYNKLRGYVHYGYGSLTQRYRSGGSGSQSSNAWKRRHEKDPYVKKARMEGSPSRAIFKIEEIDKSVAKLLQRKKLKSFRTSREGGLFHSGDTVLDLGVS